MNQSLINKRNLNKMFKPAMSGFFDTSLISFIIKNVIKCAMSSDINYIMANNIWGANNDDQFFNYK